MKLNIIDTEVLNILMKAAQDAKDGLYRSEIYEACESAQCAKDVSRALNRLMKNGLIRKGERSGLNGCLWTFLRIADRTEPEQASNEVEKTEQKDVVQAADAEPVPEAAAKADTDEKFQRLMDEMAALELQLEPSTIERYQEKSSMLERLSFVLCGEIGALLQEVAKDIQRIGRL